MKQALRVLVIDDHPVSVQGLKSSLIYYDFIGEVKGANDAESGLKMIADFNPSVIILDIELPGMNGFETVAEIHKINKRQNILIMTMHDEIDYVLKMLKLDVNGYILKNADMSELLKAVRKVGDGELYLGNRISKRIMEYNLQKEFEDKSVESLSEKDKEILKLITKEMSTAEIAAKLHLSVSTIETYRKNLIRKLGVKNMIGLAKFAISAGLVK